MIPNWREGLVLPEDIVELRDTQVEALEWAFSREEPYLLINAPTGSGKTLINAIYGAASDSWTYGVHTIMLQEQVARMTGLPVLTGRRHYRCWVDPVMADVGVCVVGERCRYDGKTPPDFDPTYPTEADRCPYYKQLHGARNHPRIANYSMILGLAKHQPLLAKVLVADEAHKIEDIVVDAAGFRLSRRTYQRFDIEVPEIDSLDGWSEWAAEVKVPPVLVDEKPDLGAMTVRDQIGWLRKEGAVADSDGWIVEPDDNGVSLHPVWGAEFVLPNLFGHREPPPGMGLSDILDYQGVAKVLMTSATLMGPEYIAERLGLPDGSWAYLDLPSTFPVEHRPINFAPVVRMNYENGGTAEGRLPMQEAVDRLIGFYLSRGRTAGLIHAVSNRYRDQLLTESSWRDMLVTEPKAHEARVRAGKPSVIVAANLTEGWDGADGLCRFILFPKVPFPSLADARVQARRKEDARSYLWATLVAVVQGAGRGVRHREDYADTWILDENWKIPYRKAKEAGWLPESFQEAYQQVRMV